MWMWLFPIKGFCLPRSCPAQDRLQPDLDPAQCQVVLQGETPSKAENLAKKTQLHLCLKGKNQHQTNLYQVRWKRI